MRITFPWATLDFLDDPVFSINPNEIEQQLVQMIYGEVRGGMNVVDIGAHQGMYTSLLAALVGQPGDITTPPGAVHAFEPHKDNFYYLTANMLNLGHAHVMRYNVALSKGKRRLGTLRCVGKETGSHHLVSANEQPIGWKGTGIGISNYHDEVVQVMRLDDFELGKVDFIKIDAEGEEVNILEGAVQTICKYKPMIAVEVHSDENRTKVYDFAKSIDFQVYRFADKFVWLSKPEEQERLIVVPAGGTVEMVGASSWTQTGG